MSEVRCGVAGSPIAHSLSPVLHRAAYDALGLDWTYDAHLVDAAGLPEFLDGLGTEWRGMSLTMPLKEPALASCTELSATARQAAAVNTLVLDPSGRRAGHNTDVAGFVAAWREAGFAGADKPLRHAVVLGGGATARSALLALAEVGVPRVTALVRSPQRAVALQDLVAARGLVGGVVALSRAEWEPDGGVDVVVSAVPAPAQADVLAAPAGRAVRAALQRGAALFDVAYGPLPTPLMLAARAAGSLRADGFGLLLHQAARQVELMTGCGAAPVEPMRAAGLAAMRARACPPRGGQP